MIAIFMKPMVVFQKDCPFGVFVADNDDCHQFAELVHV